MTTAVTYCRVSSDKQVDNTSLDDQDARTKKHISDKGWTLVRAFREEGKSAKTDDRPQLKALLQFCQENEVDYVVALDMTRLSRNTEAFLRIRRTLAAVGTKLSFTSFDPGDTPEGKFMSVMQAAMAEFDNDQRGLKSKRGMEATQKAGGWVAHAPKGYRPFRRGRLPSLEPSDDAYAVRMAFEAVANGEKTVAEAAKSIGVAKGNAFFSRPVFAGFHEIDGELVKGSWPAIVPIDVWYRAQERVRHWKWNRPEPSDFWLRGYLRCACGHMLTASYSKGRSRKYGYYHCAYCKARHPAAALEASFLQWLGQMGAAHREELAYVMEAASARFRAIAEKSNESKKAAAAESARLGKRLDALLDLHLGGGITREEYDAKRAELTAKRLEVQQHVLESGIDEGEAKELLDNGFFILDHLPAFLRLADPACLMTVARDLAGSTIDVDDSGGFSNREKDGLYCYLSPSAPQESNMATLMEAKWNQLGRTIVTRTRIARAICESVLGKESKE